LIEVCTKVGKSKSSKPVRQEGYRKNPIFILQWKKLLHIPIKNPESIAKQLIPWKLNLMLFRGILSLTQTIFNFQAINI
jgi:hypothetical protein|tara:strand:+ start:380835 stop:381071 length:237 start_codon:yes stop_codon:yes gene_type:complete